jgi:hypothetical protein
MQRQAAAPVSREGGPASTDQDLPLPVKGVFNASRVSRTNGVPPPQAHRCLDAYRCMQHAPGGWRPCAASRACRIQLAGIRAC